MDVPGTRPIGYIWRSSTWFIISTVSIALFIELFLYGFLVPMLPYLFQDRLHKDPSQTQRLTAGILTLHGLVSAVSGPLIGHFADKMPNRRKPLLFSLAGCVVGTLLVAWSPSLVVLLLGRVLQGIAGSAVWIVGLATAADTVNENHMGKMMGLIMSFASAGIISGPMVSGILLDSVGYWLTWCVPLGILVIDIIARLLMIENPHHSSPVSDDADETTTLLPEHIEPHDASTTFGFWIFLLRDSRVLTALAVTILTTAILTSFHATLPLHTEEAFGWKPRQVGITFFLLSVPALFLSTPAGWLRDRIGVRLPITISLALHAIFHVLVGVAGNDRFPWASSQHRGPVLYISSIICLGILRPFVTGVGPVEVTASVRDYEKATPGIFGPRGGLSRVYAMTDVAATGGMTIGPAVSGFLREKVGYTSMNWAFGVVYIILAIFAAWFLRSK
ncbi:hypothetical protein PENCOP_c013G07433 [Penicillium coprophilum]|uniref:Major facilitator superfamily (MFS) profile domain-containing protein n=1 Tax=Penicillium coprophilum TaxID=36646 RepID=A0A1V6UA02_9EURO|nr:hypothetical protein PENCOP_c013G07433 [Penicillium coprophilum]